MSALLSTLHVGLQRTCSLLPYLLVSLCVSVQHLTEVQQSRAQQEELQNRLLEQDAIIEALQAQQEKLQQKLLEQDPVIGDLQAQLNTYRVASNCI